MALAEEIKLLTDNVLAELTSTYNYYTDTKIAWKIVHKFIESGNRFKIRNMTTDTVTTQIELSAKARGYIAQQLSEATFQQFISIFENYFMELLEVWLTAYPKSLSNKQVDFKTILEQPDKDAIIKCFAKKELNELLYKKPEEWFAYLRAKINLGCPSADEINRFAEAKASRDLLVHNKGIANKIYESKAGHFTRFRDGERIDIPDHYHRGTWELIKKLVSDISNSAIAKLP